MTDLRQTPEYAKYMENLGWVVNKKNNVNYYIKKFPLFGSFLKVQRPNIIDFNKIDKISNRFRSFQIVIEPRDKSQELEIINYGYKQSNSYFVPSKTIQIDLTKSEKSLLSEMHYKTRYNIKKAKSNIQIKSSNDIKFFVDFWQDCAFKQRGMFIPQKREIKEIYTAFGKKADLIFAIYSNELLAGILLIHTKKTSYYMYAASSSKGKKLFAPTLTAWKAITLSKKRGSKVFDFEGIYDERFPLKSWKGFTRFKKSFGGKELEYPGAFTKFRFPF